MASFGNVAEQAKQFWGTRNGRQKVLLLGGAAVTVALLTFFTRTLSAPDYKPLYKDMEPSDAQALVTQLDSENIPHQLSSDGRTVSVPADKLDAARLQTASKGQPHSGRLGFEIFDKASWGQTEFDEKVAYQRALEGELERTVQTLSDVESARVHLVMPTESVFLDNQRPAKASVIVKLRRDNLSKDAVTAISRMVAGAVDGLKPEDVAIIDADSDRLLGLSHDNNESAEGEEARLEQRLINTLEPVVGTNAIRASVNIQYDQGSTEQSEEKYDPAVSALLSVQRSEDQQGATPASTGVPGTASNLPTQKQAKPAPVPATQSSKTESAQYGVNKTVVHMVVPAGRVQRLTAALLVDDTVTKSQQNGKVTYTKRKRTPEELAQIQQLAEAAIGFDTKRGDTISVQNLSFSANHDENDLPSTGWTTHVQKAVSDYSSLLRPVSLLALFLMVYLFVVRPVQKQVLTQSTVNTGMQPAIASANVAALAAEAAAINDPSRRAALLKQQAFELVRQKPLDTARAMQAWMQEE
jgi:flagellar M-ring protein FliF